MTVIAYDIVLCKCFVMQDYADEIGDCELQRRCRETRDWIEAADRKAFELRTRE